jgi:hypothetical protein
MTSPRLHPPAWQVLWSRRTLVLPTTCLENSPLADLSLELRVDGGSIGHVDRGTGVLDDAALVVEANVGSAEVFTPPVCGDNEDLLAFQVLLDRGVGT